MLFGKLFLDAITSSRLHPFLHILRRGHVVTTRFSRGEPIINVVQGSAYSICLSISETSLLHVIRD